MNIILAFGVLTISAVAGFSAAIYAKKHGLLRSRTRYTYIW